MKSVKVPSSPSSSSLFPPFHQVCSAEQQAQIHNSYEELRGLAGGKDPHQEQPHNAFIVSIVRESNAVEVSMCLHTREPQSQIHQLLDQNCFRCCGLGWGRNQLGIHVSGHLFPCRFVHCWELFGTGDPLRMEESFWSFLGHCIGPILASVKHSPYPFDTLD